jgi:hypothetical protein
MTLAGCAGRAELWPNGDPLLRKTSTQFAADAAKRFPYKADAPRGGQALANAEVGYFLDRLDVTNLSDVEWTDVEVWVNGAYVVQLPRLEPRAIKSVPFQAIFNAQGQSFPTRQGSWFRPQPLMIDKVELYRDGKLYDVPVRAAE